MDLREATEDDAMRRNPMFSLVFDYGFDWKAGQTKAIHSISRIKCNTFISSPEIKKTEVTLIVGMVFFVVVVLFKSSIELKSDY